jgi:hypothetical protein
MNGCYPNGEVILFLVVVLPKVLLIKLLAATALKAYLVSVRI